MGLPPNAEKKGEKEMKLKAIAGIIVTLLLATAMFGAVPTSAQPPIIDIGVIGPVGWLQNDGMVEGATIAANWINDPAFDPAHGSGQGIVIDGVRHEVQLHFGDEHAADMRPDLGRAEERRLIVDEGCETIYGGFRTECTRELVEEAMDWGVNHFICGSATNDLIDCGDGTCGACVRCDYARYKHVFRITPINNTMLFYNILGFIKGYALPTMAGMYGSPVNVAVIAEDLAWTVFLYNAFVYGGYLGPQANVVTGACARTPYGTVDFTSYLDAMHAAQIRVMLLIYSAPDSIALISQYAAHSVKAVPVGIDVLGQGDEMWGWTGGGCEYEAFLASTGTMTPISTISYPYTTQELYQKCVDTYGHAPIYTMWGVYDGIIALRETLERADAGGCPDPLDPEQIIPWTETTDRDGVLGHFKYTGPSGTLHDPYSVNYVHDWPPPQYVRAMWIQWQAARREVTFPIYSTIPNPLPYWKRFLFPPRMWPYPLDLTYDGLTDMRDIAMAAKAFGTYPGHPRYDHGAAVIAPPLDVVDMRDIAACARAFGTYWSPYPVPY